MTYIIIVTIAFVLALLCYMIDNIITNSNIFRELRKTHWETVMNLKIWLCILILLCTAVMIITGIIGAIAGITL